MSRARAVFFDRDGTLMEEVHYCGDPARVRVFPGVPEALRKLKEAGFRTFVITNQSGIARGRSPSGSGVSTAAVARASSISPAAQRSRHSGKGARLEDDGAPGAILEGLLEGDTWNGNRGDGAGGPERRGNGTGGTGSGGGRGSGGAGKEGAGRRPGENPRGEIGDLIAAGSRGFGGEVAIGHPAGSGGEIADRA